MSAWALEHWKPYVHVLQKHDHFLWAKAYFKWNEGKCKTYSEIRLIELETLFGNHGSTVVF